MIASIENTGMTLSATKNAWEEFALKELYNSTVIYSKNIFW